MEFIQRRIVNKCSTTVLSSIAMAHLCGCSHAVNKCLTILSSKTVAQHSRCHVVNECSTTVLPSTAIAHQCRCSHAQPYCKAMLNNNIIISSNHALCITVGVAMLQTNAHPACKQINNAIIKSTHAPLRVVAGSFMMAKVMGHLKESGTSAESSRCSGTSSGGGQCTSLCRWWSLNGKTRKVAP